MKHLLIILIYILIWCKFSHTTDQLLSVVQIFRHGQRTPIVFYATDPYMDTKYWNGLKPGALTETGKIELHNLGKYFREKYNTFIGEEYNKNELLVKSSKSDRNIKSAEYFLDALFVDSDQKIPIEIADWPIMSILVMCLKYDAEYLKLEGMNEEFMEINKNNKELYKYLREQSEFPIFGLLSALIIWDTLNVENIVKLPLPEWTKNVFPQKLKEVSNNGIKFLCYNEEQQKLGVGALLNEIIEHFEKIITGTEEPKILIYSGHDINLGCLLNTFQYFQKFQNYHIPPFASSITIELRKDITNKYFINTYYKPEDEAIPITVRNCEFNCELDQFRDIFKDIRLTNKEWYKECFYL